MLTHIRTLEQILFFFCVQCVVHGKLQLRYPALAKIMPAMYADLGPLSLLTESTGRSYDAVDAPRNGGAQTAFIANHDRDLAAMGRSLARSTSIIMAFPYAVQSTPCTLLQPRNSQDEDDTGFYIRSRHRLAQ